MDAINNFIKVKASAGYLSTDLSVVLQTGEGAKLPDPSIKQYNLVWFNSTDYSDPTDDPYVEIVRVTGLLSDTITIQRPNSGNSYNGETSDNTAHDHNISGKEYTLILGPTYKIFNDIDTEIQQRIVGPASSTDNAIVRFDGITGKIAQDSGITISDNDEVAGVAALSFDTLYVGNGLPVGTFFWNPDMETMNLMVTNDVTLQLGEEMWFNAINQTGVDIPDATVVMFDGSLGASGIIKCKPAVADGTYPSQYIMGVTTEPIANGDMGKVTFFGEVRGVDTSTYDVNKVLYVDPLVAGGLTQTVPQAPNLKYSIATPLNAKSNGSIFVRAIFPLKLSELDDTEIISLTSGDLLVYNGTAGRWENATLASVADGTYLRLDAGNDPVTGNLLIKPTTNSTSTLQVQPSASTTPVISVDTTNQRVGINMASPTAPFQIYNDSVTSGIGALLLGTGTNTSNAFSVNGRAMFGLDATRGTAVVQGLSGKGIDFNVNNSTFGSGQAMTISSAGAVNVVGNITAANLSGTNTGDETTSTIKTKLGISSSTTDGYLTSADWNTFNGKGTGDVVGPFFATDGNLAVFDGATGKLIKDGGIVGGIPSVTSNPVSGVTGQQIINTSRDEYLIWYPNYWHIIYTFISSLKLESDDFLLLEDGYKILLERN